jgi:tRNA (guanine-N7-)-methyltransferase
MSFSLSHGKPLEVGHIGVSAEELPPIDAGPIDLKAWFGPHAIQQPLELEIGSGKGTFLVQQATLNPHVSYIGIEYARAFWRFAADRCRRHQLDNARFVHTEAAMFLRCYAPDAAFRQVHIYFPDPWPKKRHHKRRLIQEDFLTLLHRKLEPAGFIRLATDHADYFQWMTEHVERVPTLYERLPFEAGETAAEGELIGTNFERKYRKEGREFFAMILRRIEPTVRGQAAATPK